MNKKGPADSPIKTLSETKSVQSISILYGGIHSMSQFIEIYLEKAFSKFHMSIEIANSDDSFGVLMKSHAPMKNFITIYAYFG